MVFIINNKYKAHCQARCALYLLFIMPFFLASLSLFKAFFFHLILDKREFILKGTPCLKKNVMPMLLLFNNYNAHAIALQWHELYNDAQCLKTDNSTVINPQ
jgi:hypothetical protein